MSTAWRHTGRSARLVDHILLVTLDGDQNGAAWKLLPIVCKAWSEISFVKLANNRGSTHRIKEELVDYGITKLALGP